METQWLTTFATAARLGNFRAAAKRLFVNQATVSHHVNRLENVLGAALFEPAGRGVRLTPAGERYLSYAEQILALQTQAALDVQSAQGPALHLAAAPSLGETVLPWLVRSLYRKRAELNIRVSIQASQNIAASFFTARLDGALTRLPVPVERLASRLLFHDPIKLVGPADADPWEIRRLMEQRLILQPYASYSEPLLDQWRGLGFRPAIIEVEPISVIKRLVEEHLGVAALPETAVVREVMEGRLADIPWPDMPPLWDRVYWTRRKDSRPAEAVTWAEDILRARWPGPGRHRTTPDGEI